jgi:prefoldin subunit 5
MGSHYYLASTLDQRHEDIKRRLTELERHKQKVEEHWEEVAIVAGVLENCVAICDEWKSKSQEEARSRRT